MLTKKYFISKGPMTPNIRLLIIEDNPAIVENMTEFLESKGYILDFAMDGIGGLHLALTRDYDVIVLDLMLPGMDGIALCRKLRREADKHVPVIMVTARDTLDDKLLGFESGADDYLVKPFALKELEARIKALAKRRVSTNKVLAVDDLRMNLGTYEVTRGDKKIDKPFEHFITCKRGDESRLWPGAEHSFPAVQTLWLETDH
jgi:DNA-binding response OmpR family regulator